MTDRLPIELWPLSANTGWGLFCLGLALGLKRQGRTVYIPPSDPTDIPATLKPTLETMQGFGDIHDKRILLVPYGLHWPPFKEIPNRHQVLIYMAEDTAIPDHAVIELKKYPLVLAPSRWAQWQLARVGVSSTLYHQGMNESLFTLAPRNRRDDGRFYIFSGGKLELRKSQDVVVEVFKRFRETPDGKDSVLVTAWQNHWVKTMDGIWLSGYVKGVPTTRNGQQDISAWLEINGIPREAHIDLGFLPQAQMAEAMRECDVAIFPNRCEAATNLVLPEAMGLGIPCIVGNWTGQADVADLYSVFRLNGQTPVTLSCSIYKGYDGWGEPSVDECVARLIDLRRCSPSERRTLGHQAALVAQTHFGWTVRSRAMDEILTEHFG